MRRFWISPSQIENNQVRVEGDLFHHIREVCRFDVGGKFEVLPGDGRALFVEVKSMDKRSLQAEVLEERLIPSLPRPRIHLLISLPRFSTFEMILEKSAELGVSEITPLFSDFSFVRTSEKLTSSRLQRWNKILISACQQCGRGQMLELHEARSLSQALKEINLKTKVQGLFPYEGETSQHLKAQLQSLDVKSLDEVWIFVGSEGGFSLKEVELFQQHGLNPVTLGDQILRVETACLALVSIIKYHFQPLGE